VIYLQVHTFKRIETEWVRRYNWWWHQLGDRSLQSAARTEFDESRVH